MLAECKPGHKQSSVDFRILNFDPNGGSRPSESSINRKSHGRRMCDVLLQCDMKLRREADVHQLLVVKEKFPPEQQDQDDPEPGGGPGSDRKSETREPPSVPVGDSRRSAAEKPLSCSECGRRFKQRGHLKQHLKTHTGEKPFSCSVCRESFAQRVGLQTHMRTHKGVKPLSCSWTSCLRHHQCGQYEPTRYRLLLPRPPTDGRMWTVEPQSCSNYLNPKMADSRGWSSSDVWACPEAETEVIIDGWEETREPQTDVQQLLVSQEQVPPQQLDWSSSDDDEDKPLSSQLHLRQQMEIEAHGQDCGGPGPAGSQRLMWISCLRHHQCGGSKRSRYRLLLPRPPTDGWIWTVEPLSDLNSLNPKIADSRGRSSSDMWACPEAETEVIIDGWEETREPQTVLPSDIQEVMVGAEVQQLLVVKEEVPPEQQEWSSSVDQEDPEPPHIKEEEEELWSSQEGEQLQGLEEADITKFTFTPVPVKSEDDEEKPQSEGHHCGGPGPGPGLDRNSHPDPDLEPDTKDEKPDDSLVGEIRLVSGDSSEAETDDSDDWTETRDPQSGFCW
uniref:uncharacterized protein LOC117264011 n=1 Tax=Epinephelus lanceolatus TaxID=310571 RepID=UPI001445F4AA|nr:uncharacterized protein LOC117264011 [Epinephelus lanceolatus]